MTSQNQSSPKNMLEFAKMIEDESTETQPTQQSKQTKQPIDTGMAGEEMETSQAPASKQPKSMLDFAKMIEDESSQEMKDMPEKETEEPRAGGFERSRVRAMEAIAGMPGGILQGSTGILGHVLSDDAKKILYGASSMLPTAEDIKKFHEKYTGEYYKAQTPGELKSDELVQDTVNIGLPMLMSGGAATGAAMLKNLGKIAGVVGAGQAGKEGAKALGYEQEGQEYAKLGSQMLVSLVNPKLGKDLKNRYYAEADRMPKAVKGNARPLLNSLQEELNWAKSHTDTADKAFIRNMLEPFHKDISKTGRLSFQAAREFLQSMNRNASELYKMSSASRKLARAKIDSIRAKFDPFLKQGNQYMPGWYENVKAGNQIHGALEGSKTFAHFVKNNFSKLKHTGVPVLMLDQITGHASTMLGVGATAAGGAVHELGRLGYKMYRSPLLAKAYTEAVVAAGANNLPAVANSMRKMDRELKKTEEED